MQRQASFRGRLAFCSNFSPCRIEWQGVVFPSVEHAFQAAKTLDLVERRRIASLPSAAAAKAAGRRLPAPVGWAKRRGYVMGELLRLKFAPGSEYAKKLLATGSEELVEVNTWGDTYWGKCYTTGGELVGENILGRILMKIRRELQAAEIAEADQVMLELVNQPTVQKEAA